GPEAPGLGPVVPRSLAVVQAHTLDAQLAGGLHPSATPTHRLRAKHLRRPRVRRHIAFALEGAVKVAGRPPCQEPGRVPVSREAIRRSQGDVLALARMVATTENPRTQGIAIAFRLAFDGGSALFLHQEDPNAIERLANTVQAAQSALRVSGDFDAS